MDLFMGTAIFVVALFLGIAFGADAYDGSWQKDCQQLGLHRSGGKVYECKVKP